jgi:hypothetical protein
MFFFLWLPFMFGIFCYHCKHVVKFGKILKILIIHKQDEYKIENNEKLFKVAGELRKNFKILMKTFILSFSSIADDAMMMTMITWRMWWNMNRNFLIKFYVINLEQEVSLKSTFKSSNDELITLFHTFYYIHF